MNIYIWHDNTEWGQLGHLFASGNTKQEAIEKLMVGRDAEDREFLEDENSEPEVLPVDEFRYAVWECWD